MDPVFFLNQDFLDQFLCWIRLEPRCRSEEQIQQGLETRIADPLWMLARQWQMGEFQAEDNGSPVEVEIEYTTKAMNQLGFGNDRPKPLVQTSPPLETLVEREPLSNDPLKVNWRTRVQIGRQFERILQKDLGDDADKVIVFLLKPENLGIDKDTAGELHDYATQRFLKLMAGRVVDGGKVIKAYEERLPYPKIPPSILTAEKREKYVNAFARLYEWYRKLYSQPEDRNQIAWQQPDLSYRFSLQSRSNNQTIAFEAPDYRNGDLEWYAHDFKGAPTDRPAKVLGDKKTLIANPTRVHYAGKPNERWWTFEDHQVNLAALDPDKTDLAKLLLTEFSVIYADDWFIVPLEVPLGNMVTIKSLKVKNAFGDPLKPIPPAIQSGETESKRWELFTHTCTGDYEKTMQNVLLLPLTFGDREESAPLEEVHFIRDEMANMVFAIEKTVRNDLGKSIDGFQAQLERKLINNEITDAPPPVNTDAKLRYLLATPVPENWIPYITVSNDDGGGKLRQGIMLRSMNDGQPVGVTPMTSILKPGEQPQDLHEESIPRSGVKVLLTAQRVRGCDGSTHVWFGRKVQTGRGEGNSGLKFDHLFPLIPKGQG
ncbi:MAG: hypothetical protein ABIK15_09005 [Pseudomonadota bacterium]